MTAFLHAGDFLSIGWTPGLPVDWDTPDGGGYFLSVRWCGNCSDPVPCNCPRQDSRQSGWSYQMPDNTAGDWAERALCAEIGADLWYPDKGDNMGAFLARKACLMCPVAAECGAAAEARDEQFGIWSGKSRHRRWERAA